MRTLATSIAAEMLRDAVEKGASNLCIMFLSIMWDTLCEEDYIMMSLTALRAWKLLRITVRRRCSYLETTKRFETKYGFRFTIPVSDQMRYFDLTYWPDFVVGQGTTGQTLQNLPVRVVD